MKESLGKKGKNISSFFFSLFSFYFHYERKLREKGNERFSTQNCEKCGLELFFSFSFLQSMKESLRKKGKEFSALLHSPKPGPYNPHFSFTFSV
jgi:hypothetical protein